MHNLLFFNNNRDLILLYRPFEKMQHLGRKLLKYSTTFLIKQEKILSNTLYDYLGVGGVNVQGRLITTIITS